MRTTCPLPAGTRVHHRAYEWSRYFTEAERQANPSSGWATVLGSHGPYPDPWGPPSYEYVVRYDAPPYQGGPTESQWAAYHIDHAEDPVSARAV